MKQWYSALLELVVLAEHEGALHRARSVVVFRATDWDDAKRRAIDLGLQMEESYVGGTGEAIRWRLRHVETIDLLGPEITDGREVYSEPADVPPGLDLSFDTDFDPSQSTPGHSGV